MLSEVKLPGLGWIADSCNFWAGCHITLFFSARSQSAAYISPLQSLWLSLIFKAALWLIYLSESNCLWKLSNLVLELYRCVYTLTCCSVNGTEVFFRRFRDFWLLFFLRWRRVSSSFFAAPNNLFIFKF